MTSYLESISCFIWYHIILHDFSYLRTSIVFRCQYVQNVPPIESGVETRAFAIGMDLKEHIVILVI